MPDRYIDPNSGAAPQPGGHASGPPIVRTLVVDDPNDQDKGSEVAPEDEQAAMSGAALPQEPPAPPAQEEATPETTPEPAPVSDPGDDEDDPEGDTSPPSPELNLEDLSDDELEDIAEDYSVPGYAEMSREDLLKALS